MIDYFSFKIYTFIYLIYLSILSRIAHANKERGKNKRSKTELESRSVPEPEVETETRAEVGVEEQNKVNLFF